MQLVIFIGWRLEMDDLRDFFKYKQVINSIWDKKIKSNCEELYDIHKFHTNGSDYNKNSHIKIIRKFLNVPASGGSGTTQQGEIFLGKSLIPPSINLWCQSELITPEYNPPMPSHFIKQLNLGVLSTAKEWSCIGCHGWSGVQVSGITIYKHLKNTPEGWSLYWETPERTSAGGVNIYVIKRIFLVYVIFTNEPDGFIDFVSELNSMESGTIIKAEDYKKINDIENNQKIKWIAHKNSLLNHCEVMDVYHINNLSTYQEECFYTLSLIGDELSENDELPFFAFYHRNINTNIWRQGANLECKNENPCSVNFRPPVVHIDESVVGEIKFYFFNETYCCGIGNNELEAYIVGFK